MTSPEKHPCPTCGTADRLAVYIYPAGLYLVECGGCNLAGPAAVSAAGAVAEYNRYAAALAAPARAAGNV